MSDEVSGNPEVVEETEKSHGEERKTDSLHVHREIGAKDVDSAVSANPDRPSGSASINPAPEDLSFQIIESVSGRVVAERPKSLPVESGGTQDESLLSKGLKSVKRWSDAAVEDGLLAWGKKRGVLEGNLSKEDIERISKALDVSSEEVKDLRREFEKHARNPFEILKKRMRDNKVVGIGEFHGIKTIKNQIREAGPEIIESLREAGATHLALELPITFQSRLDEFMETGQMEESEIPGNDYKGDYLPLLVAARDAGMQILAIDVPEPGGEDTGIRNKFMSDCLNHALADPDSKLVIWIGALHLEGSKEDRGQSLAELLRAREVKVSTVFPELPTNDYALTRLVSDLEEPVMISTKEAKHVGSLLLYGVTGKSFFNDRYYWWDDVFVFPSRKASKAN